MNNLITIEELSKEEIENITDLAESFKKGRYANHQTKHAALIFFENSTRTRFSFECALNRLGAHPYIFDNSKSSTSKGEEIFDTLNNLCAIGIDTFIIRAREENLFSELMKNEYYKPVHFINAGMGKTAHPTQALLDYFTMREKMGDVKNKKIVIIGDIKHSRVAKSNTALLKKMGANVVTCAPSYFREEIEGVVFEENLDKALSGADVVMCLRIQNERLEETISREDFIKNYRINSKNFPKNAILMHPGPVNRDIEIESELLNSKIGETILNQAQNGVYVRMAVLDKIFNGGLV
ncbi:MAG: aspartate carbamoyltransferase catalytic subunit [Candidatus Gastranaerophilales bacterium]|nr:aspartate carbamoyltransferase catalytic subunit [Candidatus Gastranaerophilales bacterium]